MKKKDNLICSILLVAWLMIAMMVIPGLAICSELMPGTVVNSENIEQYKEYFPNFIYAFIKGTNFLRPISLKVKESKEYWPPKSYMEASENNKNTLSLNPDGSIKGDSPIDLADPLYLTSAHPSL